MQVCDLGRTDQTYYKPYIEVSKISNTVIDFDMQNIHKALEQDGKSESAERVVGKVQRHFLDSCRIMRRSYGNKLDYDFQLFNWGVALTADVGMESDRVDLLMLTYGRTAPNRITLMEFETIMLKHTSFKHMEKKERRLKWSDLVASFKIQAGSQRSVDVTKSIGKRQMRSILDVNEIEMALDLSEFAIDLRHNDRYMSRIHSLLVEDPLISGKRLSTGPLYGKTSEERSAEEKRRMEAFSNRIAAEEDETKDLAQLDSVNQEEDPDAALKAAFVRAAEINENRAATRAIRMAEKAEKRREEKEIQDQRHAAASAAAKLIGVSAAKVTFSDALQDESDSETEGLERGMEGRPARDLTLQQHVSEIGDGNKTETAEVEVESESTLENPQPPVDVVPLSEEELEAKSAAFFLLSPPLVFPMRASRDIRDVAIPPDQTQQIDQQSEKQMVQQTEQQAADDLLLVEMSARLEEHRRIRADESALRRQQRADEKQQLKALAEERLTARSTRLAQAIAKSNP